MHFEYHEGKQLLNRAFTVSGCNSTICFDVSEAAVLDRLHAWHLADQYTKTSICRDNIPSLDYMVKLLTECNDKYITCIRNSQVVKL